MNKSNTELVAVALDAVAVEIRQLHTECTQAAESVIKKAIRIGELLYNKKLELEHGQWLPWMAANIQFSERTAQNYIRIFHRQHELKYAAVADLPLRSVLQQIGSVRKEEQSVKDAEKDAEFIVEVIDHISRTRHGIAMTACEALELRKEMINRKAIAPGGAQ